MLIYSISAGVIQLVSNPYFEAFDFIKNYNEASKVSILLCLQFYMIWLHISF